MARIDPLLQALVGLGGSNLHVSSGAPPAFRVNGPLWRLGHHSLDLHDTQDLLCEILSEEDIQELERDDTMIAWEERDFEIAPGDPLMSRPSREARRAS